MPHDFAKMREAYLKQSFPQAYAKMREDGTLKEHLQQVGQEADEMWQDLRSQMMTAPDLPESYPERVQELEAIPEKVREMVLTELIHVAPT